MAISGLESAIFSTTAATAMPSDWSLFKNLPAYRGYRCHVLDYLVEYYDLIQSEQSSSQRIIELQRRYTSSVFILLQPEKYIKKMQKTAKKSFADKKSIEDVVGFTLNSRYNRYGHQLQMP